MPAADATITLTVNENSKTFSLSDKIALYEQRTFSIVTASGNTWPSGSYTIVLTYYGQTMALAACTYNAGALSAALSLATTELERLFSFLRNPKRLQLDLTIWDNTNKTKWTTGKADVWFTEYTTASATPTPVPNTYYNGTTAITNGALEVTVDLTAYGLTAAPAQVFLSVKVPTSSDNIFVSGWTASATTITVQLSSNAPSSSYVLNWLFFPA